MRMKTRPNTQNLKWIHFLIYIKKHPILGYKYVPKGQEGTSLRKLNKLRNEFIHFMPKGWAIGLNGLPDIFRDCLNLMEELGNSPTQARWYEPRQSDEFKALMKTANEAVNNVYNR